MKKTSIIMFVVGVIIIGVVFYFLNQKKVQAPTNTQQTNNGPIEVVVGYNSNDESYSPVTKQVPEGSSVVIKVTSDVPDEVHFHGYDLRIDLKAFKEGQIEFRADKTGRFEFELENRKKTLGVIEVLPK